MALPLVGAHAVLEGMPQFCQNADTVNSKIGGIHKSFDGLGGIAHKAGGFVSGAFSTMVKASVGAGVAVAGIGAGIVKLGVDAAALPGIESVFKNMTSSMGVDADALMGKMRAATYGAVKDFDLMKSANKAMVGAGQEFGKMFAESLPTLMQVSREAAKAQGVSVEYMYESIVTGVKRMSPMILDNLGFQFSLTEAQEKYAASVGKTSKELSKEEKQMALLQEVLRSGNILIEQSGGHVDSVTKDALAWGTALRNVKDRVGIELLPILQKFMDLVGKPSQGMQDAIVKFASGMVDTIIPAIDAVANSISALLNGPLVALVRGFASIGTKGLSVIGNELGRIFTGGKTDFSDLFSYLATALEPALGTDLAEKIATMAFNIAGALQSFLQPIRDWLDSINDWIGPRLDILVMYFKMAMQEIMKILQGGSIQPLIDIMVASIRVLFGNDTANMILGWVDVFKKAASFIKEHSDIIIGALGGIAILLAGQQLTAGWAAMGRAASLAFTGIGKGLTGMLTPLGLVGLAAAGLGIAWQMNLFGIQDRVKEMIPVVIGAFNELKDKLINVSEVVADAGIMSPEAWEAISAIVGEDLATAFQNVAGAVIEAWKVISPFIETIKVSLNTLLNGDPAANRGRLGLLALALFGDTDTAESFITTVQSVIDTISAIVGQLGILFTNVFNTILAVTEAVWPYVQSIITTVGQAIWDVLSTVVTVIIPALVNGFLGLLTWVNDNWPVIQSVIVGVISTIWSVISTVIAEVVPFVVEKFQQIVGWVQENWPAIQETVSAVLGFVWDTIQVVLSNIQAFWQEHGDLVLGIIRTAWDFIKSTIDTAIHLVQDIITLVMALIRGDWETVWGTIGDILNTAWELIKSIVNTALALVRDLITVAWEAVKQIFQTSWDACALIVDRVFDNIEKYIIAGLNTVSKFIDTQLGVLRDNWEGVWNGIASIVKDVWNSIIGTICGGVTAAIDLINGLIDAANKVPGVNITRVGSPGMCDTMMLAKGGILNRPTFVAGEAGAEVVAPLASLLSMIKSSLAGAISEMAAHSSVIPYSGPQPTTYNYGGDTYVREYNLTTQSVVQPGGLSMEFSAMELAHV